MGSRIFVSYRRADSAAHAGRIYDRLAERFGRDRLFMDVASLDAGVDFAQRIVESVAASQVLIAVIGREWEDRRADGTRRIDDPSDFVRLEIEAALARGIPVVPVTVEGRPMPGPGELPPSLQPLVRHNALDLSDSRWDYDVGRLIHGLGRLGVRPETNRRRVAILAGGALAVIGVVAAIASLLAGRDGGSSGSSTVAAAAFSDDFADNAAGWLTGTKFHCTHDVAGGLYQMAVDVQNGDCSPIADFSADLDQLDRVRLEADVTILDAPAAQEARAVAVRRHDLPARGRPLLRPHEVRRLARHGRLLSDPPLRARPRDGPVVRQGHPRRLAVGEQHHLRVDCVTDGGRVSITLTVDGRVVVTAVDRDPLPAGRTGLIVINWGTTNNPELNDCLAAGGQDCDALRERVPVTAAFDNFAIHSAD